MTVACVCAPAPLLAQDGAIAISVGAIAIGPLSGTARQFTPGFGADLGITWNISDQIGIRIDYVQAALGAKDTPQFPASVPIQVKPSVKFGTANIVFRAPVQKIRIYVTGGIGVYHRSVGLATAAAGPISICNPWWFVCFPGTVTADRVTASRSTTDLGVNVGAGFSMNRFFAETRFHYMWGPTFSTAGGPVTATGRFLPIVVGMRF